MIVISIMKRYIRSLAFLFCLLVAGQLHADLPATTKHTSPDGKHTYETVQGDMLGMRVYTLKNGMKVYMSVNKSEPRIQTMIGIRAGSKYDPADATGLAHYLEHLLFKGTDRFGSADYVKEKVYLDRIEDLYEQYRSTTDEQKRAAIYRAIDSISGIAAGYAIANEYDKMVGIIGASGTNAWTSDEQVVYINDIPANQLVRWLTIEGERFRNPVLRLFHTELEAVYEEKNISIDDDGDQAYEQLMAVLFPNHPYGTQTTIGTIPHLKNPSIKKIREYYNQYYVPNNMAMAIAGDFNPDEAITAIENAFGGFASKAISAPTFAPEPPLPSTVVREVVGPNAESLLMAYRFPGPGNRDTRVMQMIDMILSNRTAGLIDLNLNKAQKVLRATCSPDFRNDYSIHLFTGSPLQGQTLEQVRDLILGQIDLVKRGEFDAALLPAIINDLRIQRMEASEQNFPRTMSAVDAFTKGVDWATYVHEIDDLATVTKEEIIRVAGQYYNNYALVFKRTGDVGEREKVVKPAITPVEVNREATSPFLEKIAGMSAVEIKPQFIDFKKDVRVVPIDRALPLEMHYVHNDENKLFTLYYLFDIGRLNNKEAAFAVEYLKYLGTSKMSADDVSKKFYELGCSFDVVAGDREIYISLSGLEDNFQPALQLLETVLRDRQPDNAALASLVDRTLKTRADRRKNKNVILQGALASYGRYGAKNPFRYTLSEADLKGLTGVGLVNEVTRLLGLQHRVLYYGPQSPEAVADIVRKTHQLPHPDPEVVAMWRSLPREAVFSYRNPDADTVFFVNYDMVQAEIMWIAKADKYDASLVPSISLYNEYFGGGMSSIVFQTIRESKALAYSTYSYYSTPSRREDPHFAVAYVGTQADKIHEAIIGMDSLLHDMPYAELAFANAKEALKNKLETERTLRTDILFAYEQAGKLGLNRDIRKDVYSKLPSMTFTNVKDFYSRYVKNGKYTMLVVGSKDRINLEDLSRYGVVKELTLEEVFGY